MSEVNFKFQIGDHVLPKMVAESFFRCAEVGERRPPEGYRVTMRCSEECVAGVQLSYLVAPWNGGLYKHAEEALVPMDEVFDRWFEMILKKKESKDKS
ncbi:MAG: hypothetical protein ACRCTG_11000 [Aestuariivirga sp.]